ncbi:AMP-binding protein [Erythrobacter sp. LQ02-29]|uniref:AMP-binding protein n=1 Tax=Erythrobacter sp. LQ02-29 TaxID=2920384 RepID=UPI001F4DCDE2|nr:AMP-binding protein [Erythrobacter sp. LQ02-29]MCP9221167.1 AMP-binding protein [Erythrobacter sp. LQ02-29]
MDRTIASPEALLALAAKGTLFSYWAGRNGDRPAILSRRGNRSFTELDANANRLLHHLHSVGLRAGDGVAMVCGNIPEFVETYLACQRGGLRLTPVNWHLTSSEAGYILSDCEARAWIIQGELAEKFAAIPSAGVLTRLATGPARGPFASYGEALGAQPSHASTDPRLGSMMLYTSGTTGRSKGVLRRKPIALAPQRGGTLCDYRDGDLNLLCGPAYHAGPLTFDLAFPIASGIPILLMEKFDAAQVLAMIERHRVTHTHMVATMFQRLLTLPPEVRDGADLSSLRRVFHGAAPTPPDIKRRMIDWLGPILYEYYGATEASPGIGIASADWLRKPGSVGRLPDATRTRILDEAGQPCPPGTIGRVAFLHDPATGPRYHNAPDKNGEVFGGAYYTVGDLGYVDDEGYLFLTGRSADVIISGGVNIYPQEVDDALTAHPAVRQACTIGVPSLEWGEEVLSLVMVEDGTETGERLERELIAYLRERLASFKLPRRIEFVADIAQSETGKVLRGAMRAPYWATTGGAP